MQTALGWTPRSGGRPTSRVTPALYRPTDCTVRSGRRDSREIKRGCGAASALRARVPPSGAPHKPQARRPSVQLLGARAGRLVGPYKQRAIPYRNGAVVRAAALPGPANRLP
ncbi:hypothetical protein HYPSUDRAFT_63185 [Hypholoma sublateritium FD-334 SS-4]|uniref:Uncharacterized protein n=1 Tax=Hypholoma sublateritium (strain FD-334 SS-4) TaxID=945553 RepID=A0A0D2MU28_HYPSF|nr:hypothetical protein HYPSUDRAFT_63185 [Hypholoma sublateritium FD-334 SS-4]